MTTSFAELAKTDARALAARVEQAVTTGLGTSVKVAIASTGPDALRDALAAAGRATDSVAGWPCRFASLSHVGDVAIAVALPVNENAAGLGVDLELDRPVRRGLARLICDAREQAWLDDVSPDLRDAELLRLWTAKEALYKADPAQGDAIVADYALVTPSASVGPGTKLGDPAPATVISIRIADGALSVAIREDQDVAR